jgi:hypothetical protein
MRSLLRTIEIVGERPREYCLVHSDNTLIIPQPQRFLQAVLTLYSRPGTGLQKADLRQA